MFYLLSLFPPLPLRLQAMDFLDFWLTVHFAGKCCPCIWRYE